MKLPPSSALLLAVAALALGAGCSAEKREAQSMLVQIEQLRATPAEQREPLIAQLEQSRANGPEAEAARQQCAQAYRQLHEGTRLSTELKRTMDPKNPTPQQLADLKRADQQIIAAEKGLGDCSRAVVKLRQALKH